MNLPRPEPAAGLKAYQDELTARLKFDERTFENFRKAVSARARGRSAVVDYLPTKLDVENTSRCNFRCGSCAVSTWEKGKRASDMSLNDFKALIDEQYGLVEIKLNGLGEALMQGDDYFEMIRYARARRIWVRMTTNASLLHLRNNYRKLADSGVNEIDISIDGVDPGTFEKIRPQSDFFQVAANCGTLNAYLAAIGRPSAKMWTLVQKENARWEVAGMKHSGLARHVAFAKRLGFQQLVFSMQLHGWGSEKLAERNAGEAVHIPMSRLEELYEIGRARGVSVAFWDVSEKFSTKSTETLCPWPFERAVVTSDLRTVPCCMIGDPDAFEIARGAKSFGEAWKSQEYNDFRQAHLDGKVPSVCRACYKDQKVIPIKASA